MSQENVQSTKVEDTVIDPVTKSDPVEYKLQNHHFDNTVFPVTGSENSVLTILPNIRGSVANWPGSETVTNSNSLPSESVLSNIRGSPKKKEWSKVQGAAYASQALEEHRSKSTNHTERNWRNITVNQAIRQGLVAELADLLKQTPEKATERDTHGLSPLHHACRFNQASIIEILLKYSPNGGEEETQIISPLHVAAKTNSPDAAEILIKHGVCLDSKDSKQKTPLHIAARRGNCAVIKVLLDSGQCNINSRDEDRLTPLHEATAHQHFKAVQILVEYGADIFATEVNEATVFLMAAAEDMTDTLVYFLKIVLKDGGAELENRLLNHREKEGNSALHVAVLNSRVKTVEFLLNKGADVNCMNNNGTTPLAIAAGIGDKTVVEMLIKNNADINVTDKDFMTPCHRAALQNRHSIINLLMNKGADINSKTNEQYTPLLLACSKGHVETVQILMSSGAQIAETDINNRTVLHVAVEQHHYSVLELLLTMESTRNMMGELDFNDQTVLHYAAKTGSIVIIAALLKNKCKTDRRDVDGKTPLHIAAEHDNDNVIEKLYKSSQTELNDGDDDGRTPLMLACKTGRYKAAQCLISLGADISARDEDFSTALILGARHGHSSIVKLLLDNSADVNQCDKVKNTSLHVACDHGSVDCIRLLLQHHADVTIKNAYGSTPLEMAINSNESDAAIAMLRHSSWRDSMKMRDKDGYTPMKQLIQKCPDAAKVVLDNCVKYSKQKRDDINFRVLFDYTYIDPGVDDPSSKKSRFYAPKLMAKYRREHLLSHILVQSNLMHKWLERGYIYFYCTFLVYFLLLVGLQIHMVIMPKVTTGVLDNVRQCPILLNDSMLADPVVVEQYKELGPYSSKEVESRVIQALGLYVMIVLSVLILNHFTMIISLRKRYFLEFDTYLTWTMVISSFFYFTPFGYYPCVSEWRAGWISISLGWLMLMNYLRGFSSIGIYYIMFSAVVVSLLKVSFILITFLMAFSGAFNIILARTTGFERDDVYPLTTFTMMLGEINYIDNFVGGGTYPFQTDSYILIIVFCLIMPLALMNFLTGIAVGDIEEVRKDANLSKVSILIKKCYQMEIRFPKSIQRRWIKCSHTVYPNRTKQSRWQKIKQVFFGSEEEVVKQCLDAGNHGNENEIEIMKNVFRKQTSQIMKMQGLLKDIARHLHIDNRMDNLSLEESEFSS